MDTFFSFIQGLVAPPYCVKKLLQSAKDIGFDDFAQEAAKDATHPVFSHELRSAVQAKEDFKG